jgi:outer membrane protein assembly factor BamB
MKAFLFSVTILSIAMFGDSGFGCQTENGSSSVAAVKSGSSAGAATVTAASEANGKEKTGDWPMWGGSPDRNMVSDTKGVSLDFDFQKDKNVIWTSNLGSQTYGNPVVAGGKVFVGTNNGGGYRAEKHPADQDAGILLAFDEKTGKFLWQLTREKLATGRVNDWPLQGICSTPVVEGDRMWIVTNRCELMCLDTEGFLDDENDGEVKDEVDNDKGDADIVWSLDMIGDLAVFPHNLATSSPVIHGDMVYLLTSNGVDEAHLEVPSPRAPCFLAVNKKTGKVVWEDNTPFDHILHGQWGSPAVGEVNGKTQIYFPGGDGWLYALDAQTGEHVWKFDLNPKETKWKLGGAGTRNAIIATPVFYDNSVLLAVGQDPEHGEGVGHLWRVDATKTGDVSAELGEIGEQGKPNPNSAVIWHYGGVDEEGDEIFRRTMSTVAIANGRVYAADLSGYVHCIDLKTGKRKWVHDLLSGVWGSPLCVDGKVFIGNEDGKLTVLDAMADEAKVLGEFDTVKFSSIYSTPTFANGNMYVSDRTRLYAVKVTGSAN